MFDLFCRMTVYIYNYQFISQIRLTHEKNTYKPLAVTDRDQMKPYSSIEMGNIERKTDCNWDSQANSKKRRLHSF